VEWWQTVMILLGIGLVSIVIGMFAGIPLSNIILRRREQVSIGKYQTSAEFEPQYTTTEQFEELLKKYGVVEVKTAEQSSEESAESENDEAETAAGQAKTAEQGNAEAAEIESDKAEATAGPVEPIAIEQILLELEKNLELSIEPRLAKLEPFQTETWDASLDIPNILTADLKWELAEAYLDMYAANNIVWFLKEFGMESPVLEEQYTKMCAQIAAALNKVIPRLKTARG